MRRILVVSIGLLAGCSAVTPPPSLLGHGSTLPAQQGSTQMQIAGSAAGGAWTGNTRTLGFRARRQISPTLAIGLQGDGGEMHLVEDGDGRLGNSAADRDRWVQGGSGRLFAHLHPAEAPWLRIAGGVGGGGASNGLSYGTVDAAFAFGTTGDRLRVFGGPLFAAAFPFERGGEVDGTRASTTYYAGLDAGLELSLGGGFSWSLEGQLLGGGSSRDSVTLGGVGTGFGFTIPGQ